ncbi:ENR1 protein, partial [Ceuthmochares aereus]|nr:ENR1 protein [Ceuthmochares aereus]
EVLQLGFPTLGKNLFVDLAERIAKELNVSGCWVCGGSLMSEEWPWKGISLDPLQILKWNHSLSSEEKMRPLGWVLSSEAIGIECISRIG